jgi:hypothetical protein
MPQAVDGSYGDMQRIDGSGARSIKAAASDLASVVTFTGRHVGYITKSVTCNSRVACGALADDKPRYVPRKPMAAPRPSRVRGL